MCQFSDRRFSRLDSHLLVSVDLSDRICLLIVIREVIDGVNARL